MMFFYFILQFGSSYFESLMSRSEEIYLSSSKFESCDDLQKIVKLFLKGMSYLSEIQENTSMLFCNVIGVPIEIYVKEINEKEQWISFDELPLPNCWSKEK